MADDAKQVDKNEAGAGSEEQPAAPEIPMNRAERRAMEKGKKGPANNNGQRALPQRSGGATFTRGNVQPTVQRGSGRGK